MPAKSATTVLAEKALASFSLDGNKSDEISISFSDATRNIMILGGTGSGKTSGVCMPILGRLINEGCPGVVLDVKGDYSQIARTEANDRCFIIGPVEDAAPINILSGLTPHTLKSVLVENTPNSRDSRWITLGADQAAYVFAVMSVILGREPNAKDIWTQLVDPNSFRLLVASCADVLSMREDLALMEAQLRGNAFSVLSADMSSERDREQYTWQTEDIISRLGSICNNPILSKYLCSDHSLPLKALIYESNKVIVFDMPETLYGDSSVFASKLLRRNVKAAIMTSTPDMRVGFGLSRFSFMLVDEYQEYASAEDNSWFDRSRSFGHINIVSTQSISSIRAKIHDTHAANTIIQNNRNQIILSTIDKDTVDHASFLAGSDVSDFLVRPSVIGGCIVYAPSNIGNRSIALASTGRSSREFMNKYINPNQARNDSLASIYITKQSTNCRPRTPAFSEAVVDLIGDAGFRDVYPKKNHWITDAPKDIRPSLFVITTSSVLHDGACDFMCTFGEENLRSICTNVYTTSGKIANELTDALMSISSIAKKHDVVAIVRGGGDKSDGSFDRFNSPVACKIISELNDRGVHTVSGIGHATDRFAIDSHVKFCEITPTAAAYRTTLLINGNASIAPISHYLRASIDYCPPLEEFSIDDFIVWLRIFLPDTPDNFPFDQIPPGPFKDKTISDINNIHSSLDYLGRIASNSYASINLEESLKDFINMTRTCFLIEYYKSKYDQNKLLD